MNKFKCSDCGYIFTGNYTTQVCPNCGSHNIKKASGGVPWKKILIALCAILVILLLFTIFKPSEKALKASLSFDEQKVSILVEGIDEDDLRNSYQVKYSSDSKPNTYQKLLFGNGNAAFVRIAELNEGETYTFYVVERKDDSKVPEKLDWKTTNRYTRPLPPLPPKIHVETTPDCHTGKYTITIVVDEGVADVYCLDDKAQSTPVFENVAARTDAYLVKVVDNSNLLESEKEEVLCPIIKAFHVDIIKIRDAFCKVGKGELKVGDAMSIINNGKNIKLTQPIDGNKKLEGILNYAYNNGIQYNVNAEIEHGDCSDRLKSITVRK